MQTNTQQTIRARTILNRIPRLTPEEKEQLKEDICKEVSGGRTVNISKLTTQESKEFCRILQAQVPKTSTDRMKKSIIAMAMEIQWKTHEGKIDMERLNSWCRKYAPLHKDMDDHSERELPKLVTAFKRNYEYVLKKL